MRSTLPNFALWLALLLAGITTLPAATTPKPGSETRTAICDAMRLYARYTERLSPQQANFKWQVDRMLVQDSYACFEGRPVEAEGKVSQFYIDQDHCTVLQKEKNGTWTVIYDLSRTDVPGPEEMAQIKKEFPKVPMEILPEFWREQLTK